MTGALWPLKRSRSRLILTSITICTCWSFLWIISYLYLSMERLRKPWLRNTPSNIQVETLVGYVNWITSFTLLLLIHRHPGQHSSISFFVERGTIHLYVLIPHQNLLDIFLPWFHRMWMPCFHCPPRRGYW